jgi:hypothetical protein
VFIHFVNYETLKDVHISIRRRGRTEDPISVTRLKYRRMSVYEIDVTLLGSWIRSLLRCSLFSGGNKQTKQTPWPLVRERSIPTDRPPLVDEI